MCTQLCESHVFEDEDVRKQVALALGEIGDARAVEPLTEALKDGWGVFRKLRQRLWRR